MFLTGIASLDIKAGAPNRAGTSERDTIMSGVKTTRIGRGVYPYVSAQAVRRWLRDTMTSNGFVPSPVTRSGSGEKQKISTAARGDRYADDDVFGYMMAGKNGATVQRDTVLATGTFVSVRPQQPTRDLGVMARGLQPGEHPARFDHDHYTTQLVGDLRLDTGRVGRFEMDGDRCPDLSAAAKGEASQAGAVDTTFRGNTTVELPIEQRRERVAGLLRALAELDGGATLNMHYGNRTPAFVLLAPMTCGANPFTRILRDSNGDTEFDTTVFDEQMSAWEDRISGPVLIGWEPGFLSEQREHVAQHLQQRHGEAVQIAHPRTLLRQVADDLEAGKHDEWFA